MKKLNDTQLVLLSTAASRDNGIFMPLPAALTAPADRVRAAITAMLKAAYAEEGEVQDAALAWRHDGKKQIGLRITDAGRAAVDGGESTSGEIFPPVIPSSKEAVQGRDGFKPAPARRGRHAR